MSIIGSLRSRSNDESGALDASPQAYVDSPQYMLTDWINICGGPMKPLGSVPSGLRVGIIGGGVAGVTAAFEAVKAGAQATMIEARSEIGGRARSIDMGSNNIAEAGGMRFPPSEAALYLLAKTFGYGFINRFPDPGAVPTLIRCSGESQLWTDPNSIPSGFETVTASWTAFVDHGCVINGKEFISVMKLAEWLQSSDKETRMQVVQKWQDYIDEFKNNTLLHGIYKIFGPSNDTPPGGRNWTEDDFDRFAKLGVGTGGYRPFFEVGFLTVIRFMPNRLETDQATFAKPVNADATHWKPEGFRSLWQSVWEWATEQGLTTLLNAKATAVSKSGDSIYTVTVETPDGRIEHHEFDELFINVTTKVAYFDLHLARTGAGQIFPDATCEAIKEVHMARTTKLFTTVKRRPYFDDPKFPRVIVTDGDLPQLYCIDCGDEDTLLVMVVYAWEDDSERLEVETDPKRLFEHLKRLAAEAASSSEYPDWAECLEPVGEIKLQHWQGDPTARGAFTFALPGQDRLCAALFYDFEKGEGPYLIGDSASFGGGCAEAALQTAFTCFSAMLKRRGELYHQELAPANLLSSSTYNY